MLAVPCRSIVESISSEASSIRLWKWLGCTQQASSSTRLSCGTSTTTHLALHIYTNFNNFNYPHALFSPYKPPFFHHHITSRTYGTRVQPVDNPSHHQITYAWASSQTPPPPRWKLIHSFLSSSPRWDGVGIAVTDRISCRREVRSKELARMGRDC